MSPSPLRLAVEGIRWIDRAVPSSAALPKLHDMLLGAILVIPIVWIMLCVVDRTATTRKVEVFHTWIMRAARRDERIYRLYLGLAVVGLVSFFSLASRHFKGVANTDDLMLAVAFAATAILTVILTFFIRQYPALRLGNRVISLRNDGGGNWSLHVRRAGPWGFVIKRMPKRANSIRTVYAAMQAMEPVLLSAGIHSIWATTPDASKPPPARKGSDEEGAPGKVIRKSDVATYRAKTVAWWSARMPAWDVYTPRPKRWSLWASFWFALARAKCPRRRVVERGVAFRLKVGSAPVCEQASL